MNPPLVHVKITENHNQVYIIPHACWCPNMNASICQISTNRGGVGGGGGAPGMAGSGIFSILNGGIRDLAKIWGGNRDLRPPAGAGLSHFSWGETEFRLFCNFFGGIQNIIPSIWLFRLADPKPQFTKETETLTQDLSFHLSILGNNSTF